MQNELCLSHFFLKFGCLGHNSWSRSLKSELIQDLTVIPNPCQFGDPKSNTT
jgi:hypothetical protein